MKTKLESFWTILATLTGGEKFTVIRNVIVLPLIIISLQLNGGTDAIAALPSLALPFYLWSNTARGRTLRCLHLPNGFLTRQSKMWVWYLSALIVGVLYGVIWAGISSSDDSPALMSMVHANTYVVAFLCALVIVLGIRKGWTDVISPDQADASTEGQKVLHLINPKGIAQRQMFFNVIGVLIFLGVMANIGNQMNAYAKVSAQQEAQAEAQAANDPLVQALSQPVDDAPPATPQPQAPAQPEESHMLHEEAQEPTPAPLTQPQGQLPSVARGLTANTYGNEVSQFIPKDKGEPQFAVQDALGKAIPNSNLNVIGVNQKGYPVYGMECEADGHCVNDGGLNLGSEANAAAEMFPVNPADVGQFGIMCDQYLCRDSQGNAIGRNPNFHG